MAQITLTVCDVCRNVALETTRWTIEGPDGKRTFELCREHGKGVQDVYRKSPAKTQSAAVRSRKRASVSASARKKVVTMEEIESLKK